MSRILAIDYGLRKVGIALTDELQIIASPFKTLAFADFSSFLSELNQIISEKSVSEIVVGMPLRMTGQDSEQTKLTRDFVEKLKSKLQMPIHIVDERLSSRSAKQIMHKKGQKTGHNKKEVDNLAASVILREFLDSRF